ncbi:MAG: hypothetical protein WEA81_04930, partial [Dehalococcoidia bacterium]
ATLRGETVRLFGSQWRPGHPDQPPGTVVASSEGSVEVAAIGGTLVIGRVQKDGQPKSDASHLLQAGDVLERPS